MLLVNARAGVSVIHGIGLIAREFIPVGTKMWVFQPAFDLALTVEELDELSPAAREQVLHYAWLDDEWGRILLSGDDDRFTNHSETPNTRWEGRSRSTVAVRNILPDEEITFYYRELGGSDHLGWASYEVKCSS